MTQELIELKKSILEERYTDALALVDELEGMSKQAILRNIDSFLVRLIIHLVKNQIEQHLMGSWAASIVDSILKIRSLNLKDNKTSYYLKQDDWSLAIDEAIDEAIIPASNEIMAGKYTPAQLAEAVNREKITSTAQKLLDLTYTQSSKKALIKQLENYLVTLPGGKDWTLGRK